jgi:hypothetical protein
VRDAVENPPADCCEILGHLDPTGSIQANPPGVSTVDWILAARPLNARPECDLGSFLFGSGSMILDRPALQRAILFDEGAAGR